MSLSEYLKWGCANVAFLCHIGITPHTFSFSCSESAPQMELKPSAQLSKLFYRKPFFSSSLSHLDWESQEYPLAQGHLPKGSAAGNFRTIRSRGVIFQRDMMRGVTGLSVRASARSKGTCYGKFQSYPLAPAHFLRGHAAGNLRTIRLRGFIFQRDMLREVSGPSARASALS